MKTRSYTSLVLVIVGVLTLTVTLSAIFSRAQQDTAATLLQNPAAAVTERQIAALAEAARVCSWPMISDHYRYQGVWRFAITRLSPLRRKRLPLTTIKACGALLLLALVTYSLGNAYPGIQGRN